MAERGTGSEPRRVMRRSRSTYDCGCVLVGDEGPRDEANRWENTHPLICPVHRAIWTGKGPVGSGHDEQTDTVSHQYFLRVIDALVAERDAARERTVAVVVEALREASENGATIDVLEIERCLAERFGSSVSGGE